MLDYFEMERVIEELAKAYPAQCATTWFKITKNHKPSEEEYRNKVVEYMKIFEYLLATYPSGPDTDRLKQVVKKILAKEIERVLKGDNKDVEKRHKHYVINSPSSSSSPHTSASAVVVYSNDTLKDVSRQQQLEKSIEITTTNTNTSNLLHRYTRFFNDFVNFLCENKQGFGILGKW